jgi:hypothetical protein
MVLLALIVLYAVALGASYSVWPLERQNYVDAEIGQRSIYLTDARYLCLNLAGLRRRGPKVLVVGSSNARLGLRPNELRPLLGGVEVDNLAVGGSNISAVREVVEQAYRNMPREDWPQATFLFGINFRSFVPDSRLWPQGLTPLDAQGLRFAFYSSGPDGVVHPSLPPNWLPVRDLMRPFLLLGWAIRELHTYAVPEVDNDNSTLTQKQIAEQIDQERQVAGPFGPRWYDSFRQFVELARYIAAHQSRLVVLELPVPSWIRHGVPAFADFEARKGPVLEEVKAVPGVVYGSIADGFGDDTFFEAFHPRPRITKRWAERASAVVLQSIPLREQ